MKYPLHLKKLIEVLKKLPGVGSKSAERYAFQLIQWPTTQLQEMAGIIGSSKDKLTHCSICGCLGDTSFSQTGKMNGESEREVQSSCDFCSESRMSLGTLCVIATARDVFAIEETGEFKGSYHVLGGLLSPMEGKGPEVLKLHKLTERLIRANIREVVIAIDSTVEGDATALYLKSALAILPIPIEVSRLAFGLPMGSSLDYVDGGTLARAFLGRSAY